jgi:hypothetical protein
VAVSGARMAAGLELCRLSKLLLIAGGWVVRVIFAPGPGPVIIGGGYSSCSWCRGWQAGQQAPL